MSSASALLETVGLTHVADSGQGARAIVADFSFSFIKGKTYTVLGPSGAGKSSLLRLLNRLDNATSGVVVLNGTDTREIPPCELRRRIGYLFQAPYLFRGTVRDNIRYADHTLSDEKIARLARQTSLDATLIDAVVDNLSVGERQRVALARLLATEPQVALLDEPTSALDPSHTQVIEKLIKSIVAQRGLTAIMVSHDPEQVLRMGGEALLIVDGKLVESGPCKQVVCDPQTELGSSV